LRRTGVIPAINQLLSGEFGVFGLALIALGGFPMLYQASAAFPEPLFTWIGGAIAAGGVLCVLLGARARS
jgi:hypothetical protein